MYKNNTGISFEESNLTDIVLMDTGFYRTQHKNIDDLYPNTNWIHAISETTFLELSDQQFKTDANIRKAILEKYKLSDIRITRDYESIVFLEAESKLRNLPLSNVFILHSREFEAKIKSGDAKNSQEGVEELVGGLAKGENEAWEQIYSQGTSKTSEITLTELVKAENSYIKEMLKNKNKSEENVDIMVEKFKYYLDMLAIKFGRYNLESKCPAFYSAVRVQNFINLLKPPKGSKLQFTINFDGAKIIIKKSFFSDIKVVAASLPYINRFISGDKGQGILIQKLFPKYAHRMLISKNLT